MSAQPVDASTVLQPSTIEIPEPKFFMRFYYVRRDEIQKGIPRKVPFACVCIGEVDGIAVRGISICSYEDQFSRKKGRRLARSRWLKAACSGRGWDEFEAHEVTRVKAPSVLDFLEQVPQAACKSEYNCVPTTFETKLLEVSEPPPKPAPKELQYHDLDGNPCTLRQLVESCPEWAVNRIQELTGSAGTHIEFIKTE